MLDAETLQKAQDELDETDERREEEVTALTTWIRNQDTIPHFTDPLWLTSFLRVAKYSQNEARSRLSKYWKSRQSGIMRAMNDADPASPCVLDILRGPNFVYVPLPGCDNEGRQLMLAKWNTLDTTVTCKTYMYSFKDWFRAINLLFDTLCFLDERVMVDGVTFLKDTLDTSGKTYSFKDWFRAINLLFDTLCFLDERVMVDGVTILRDTLDTSGKTYSFKDWFRAINLLFDTLCFLDERVMVNGVTFLMDATGLALRHLTFFGFHNSVQQFDVMQGGYPIRIKKVHYFNNNAVVSMLFSVVKKVMSTKIANRIAFHGHNMNPLYENVDMSVLPDEYLPGDYTGPRAGTCSQIMEKFIQEKILHPENLRFLRKLYSCDLDNIEPEKTEETIDAAVEEKLRRLQLDGADISNIVET